MFLQSHLGEMAALGAAFCWTGTAVGFTKAGHIIGSNNVNRLRLVGAVLVLTGVMAASGGQWPWEITWQAAALLTLSGIVGLVFGDGCLFYGYVAIGPRLTVLIFTSWPAMTAVIEAVWLHEPLALLEWVALVFTVACVAWVTWHGSKARKPLATKPLGKPMPTQVYSKDRASESAVPASPETPDEERLPSGSYAASPTPDPVAARDRRWFFGLLAAVGAAVGQAVGYVLAKRAMAQDLAGEDGATVSALTVTLTRLSTAMIAIWLLAAFEKKAASTVRTFVRQPRAMPWLLLGIMVGPVLGLWLSHVAEAYIEAGRAAALMSTMPIWMIPVSALVFGERPTWQAILGALGAVLGVAVLILGVPGLRALFGT